MTREMKDTGAVICQASPPRTYWTPRVLTVTIVEDSRITGKGKQPMYQPWPLIRNWAVLTHIFPGGGLEMGYF